jgi:hypothetical protein
LVLGTAGLTANRLSYFGIAPRTMSAISTVAGKGSMALGAFQSMYMMFDMIYNNPEINNWRPSTGDFETDFMMQLEQSKGFYNDEDYFR